MNAKRLLDVSLPLSLLRLLLQTLDYDRGPSEDPLRLPGADSSTGCEVLLCPTSTSFRGASFETSIELLSVRSAVDVNVL